jgi:acetate kinase
LARGVVDRIGMKESHLEIVHGAGKRDVISQEVENHTDAFGLVADSLHKSFAAPMAHLGVVGHRVVHGGEIFWASVRVDDRVLQEIERLVPLAPLHNSVALQGLRCARACFGESLPMVAVFDTAFHRAMPPQASEYAIPAAWRNRYQIKRYGFHGIAVAHVVKRFAEITNSEERQKKLIVLHLGNGCSATAVRGGLSIDTSMGLTPLEGLMMGTRSGDVDPSLVGYIARRSGLDVGQIEESLNKESGLLAVSERSPDMRDLLVLEEEGDPHAVLAIEMFCYRVKKYIGAYLATLGGADAILFSGGIGENAPRVRDLICQNMEWCGLKLDSKTNAATVGKEGRISIGGTSVEAYVIPVDEELVIATESLRCISDAS